MLFMCERQAAEKVRIHFFGVPLQDMCENSYKNLKIHKGGYVSTVSLFVSWMNRLPVNPVEDVVWNVLISFFNIVRQNVI